MCRKYLTFYKWCECSEEAGDSTCSEVRRNSCPGVSVETVYMQCYCNSHATRSFDSVRKTLKKEAKERRKSEQSSLKSEKSSLSRRLLQSYKWRAPRLEGLRLQCLRCLRL